MNVFIVYFLVYCHPLHRGYPLPQGFSGSLVWQKKKKKKNGLSITALRREADAGQVAWVPGLACYHGSTNASSRGSSSGGWQQEEQ